MAKTPEQWLTLLNRRLVGRQAAMALYENYYDGVHRATFILARLLEAFGRDFRDLRINYCSVVVDALNERLNLDGFLLGTDARASAAAWEIWQRSGMDDEFSRGTRSALVKSEFGLIVWPDAAGEPRLTVEDGAQLIVAVDPADKRVRRAALKRWYDEDDRRTYATALLEQRGDAFLAAAGPDRRIEAKMHQHGSFRSGRDFDLGDLVLVRSDGISFVSRVVEVTSKWSRSVETPEITLALDRPFPTLRERVAASSGGGATNPIVDAGTGGGGGTPGTGTTTSAVGDATSHGASSDYSRTDHRHGREAGGSPVALAVGDTSAPGSATTIARSDHRHGREAFGNPVASAVGDTQAGGAAASVARSDHRHAREAFGVVQAQTSFGAASADGTAATVARSDHRHGTPANPKLGVMFVPAGALLPHLTNGASGPSQIERPTNRQNAVVAEFPDGSQTDATFLTVMPPDYNGGTFTARFVWLIATGSTQTCRWQLQARGYADAQTLDQAWGTAQAVDDSGTATAYQVLISGSTPAITPGGSPAGGNLMLFRASRPGAHANDTLTQTALLAGVVIEYTRT